MGCVWDIYFLWLLWIDMEEHSYVNFFLCPCFWLFGKHLEVELLAHVILMIFSFLMVFSYIKVLSDGHSQSQDAVVRVFY